MNKPPDALGALPLSRGIWLWLIIDCFIVLIAGAQLFVLADDTKLYFAWTITPSLTATFLGSGYWSSVPLLFLSSRKTTWAHARLGVFGILVFSILTLLATLMHLDRFHLADPNPTAMFAAWVWLIIYIVFPPMLSSLLLLQMRLPGQEPPRQAPLSSWFRIVLLSQGTIMLVLGAILFIAPTALPWSWTLTPLTGRAISAWLVGIGVIAVQSVWENDWQRVGAGMFSYALFGGLQILAFIRYAALIDWRAPSVAIYLGFIASMILIGGYGWLTARRV